MLRCDTESESHLSTLPSRFLWDKSIEKAWRSRSRFDRSAPNRGFGNAIDSVCDNKRRTPRRRSSTIIDRLVGRNERRRRNRRRQMRPHANEPMGLFFLSEEEEEEEEEEGGGGGGGRTMIDRCTESDQSRC